MQHRALPRAYSTALPVICFSSESHETKAGESKLQVPLAMSMNSAVAAHENSSFMFSGSDGTFSSGFSIISCSTPLAVHVSSPANSGCVYMVRMVYLSTYSYNPPLFIMLLSSVGMKSSRLRVSSASMYGSRSTSSCLSTAPPGSRLVSIRSMSLPVAIDISILLRSFSSLQIYGLTSTRYSGSLLLNLSIASISLSEQTYECMAELFCTELSPKQASTRGFFTGTGALETFVILSVMWKISPFEFSRPSHP